MSFENDAQEVREHWNTEWGATTPTQWENTEIDPKPSGPWAALSVRPTQETPASLGTGHWRATGHVAVQLFVPSGEGETRIWSLVEQARDVFLAKTVGGLSFRGFQTQVLGVSSETGGDFQVTLVFPYQRDRTS